MSVLALRSEERLALIAALAAHGVLIGWLAWQRFTPPPVPERMIVTLSDDYGPVSTSPEPSADPAPPVEAQPTKKPSADETSPKTTKSKVDAFEAAFAPGIKGAVGAQQTQASPAAAPSAQQVSSWSSSIGARVRAPWNACAVSGLDAEKLVITVRFTLDRSGAVATMEEPTVAGITDSNRPQVDRFKECAVRAIRTAAPFDNLPTEYYEYWKSRRLNLRKQL